MFRVVNSFTISVFVFEKQHCTFRISRFHSYLLSVFLDGSKRLFSLSTFLRDRWTCNLSSQKAPKRWSDLICYRSLIKRSPIT